MAQLNRHPHIRSFELPTHILHPSREKSGVTQQDFVPHDVTNSGGVWSLQVRVADAKSPFEGSNHENRSDGGTGLIGSKLVNKLREHGHEAIPASPNSGVNTVTGEGLADVLKGASVVVDVSNSPSFDEDVAINFFNTATRNLIRYEQAAGVRHHVALSVVGTDRLAQKRPSDGEKTIRGYFRAKLLQEKLIAQSSIPFSIVHATQFFEFFKSIADTASDGTNVRVAPVLIQPMAAEDVAAAIGRVAVGAPVNGIIEVAGPQQFRLDEFIRQGLSARKDPRTVTADPAAGYFGVEVDERTLVPGKDARLGETHFETWLAQSTQPAGGATSQSVPTAASR